MRKLCQDTSGSCHFAQVSATSYTLRVDFKHKSTSYSRGSGPNPGCGLDWPLFEGLASYPLELRALTISWQASIPSRPSVRRSSKIEIEIMPQ
jgi:hypothetical protein